MENHTARLLYWPGQTQSSPQPERRKTMQPETEAPDNNRWVEHLKAISESKDRSAFGALYSYFAPKIKSFYIQHGLPEQSEELMQEVFVRVWRNAASYHPEKAAVSTWLYTIARNLKIDFLRKKRPEEISDEELVNIEDDTNLTQDVEASQAKNRISSVFHLLNEEQRNVIQKVYFEDKSHDIAARELNMTPGVVKSRIRSSMKIFRSKLGGEQL